MTPGPIQIVIDACNAPGAFDGAGGLPPLVASLKSCEPFTHIDFAAPVILCAERDAARARGAFLVSGDGDGRVIAFDPPGSAEDRLALAGLPGAALACLQPGQAFSPQMTISEVQAIGIALMPASLRGVWVPEPNQWAARCGTEFGDEQHG